MEALYDLFLSEITQGVLLLIAAILMAWRIWIFTKHERPELLAYAAQAEENAHTLEHRAATVARQAELSREDWHIIADLVQANLTGDTSVKAFRAYHERFTTTPERKVALEIYDMLQESFQASTKQGLTESFYEILALHQPLYQEYRGRPDLSD